MKTKLNQLLVLITLIMVTSCSIVKDKTSANFNRVKYNAHVKLGNKLSKSKMPETVNSFTEMAEEKPMERKGLLKHTLLANNKNVKEPSKVVAFVNQYKKEKLLSKVNQELESVIVEQGKLSSTFPSASYWWEDDVEDWPWGEIVLAFIAVLLIAIIIVVLVDLVGGVIAGLLGLILLLGLAYFLYEYWM